MLYAIIFTFVFSEPPKPKVKVTISNETTYLTSPLRADVLVDYVGAANARMAEIDPKDNAAVLLLKAFGPKALPKKGREEYLRLLRCEAPPAEGEYALDIDDLLERKWKRKPEGDESVSAYDEQGKCCRDPWKAAEHPLFAELLQVNEKPLQLAVEASKRRFFAAPFPSLQQSPNMAEWDDMYLVVNSTRAIVRLLVMRCLLRIGEGDVEGAFADLDACHRLGLLIGGATTTKQAMTAAVVRANAFAAEDRLLRSRTFSPAFLRERARLTAARPPTIDAKNCFAHWERMILLDAVIAAEAYGPIRRPGRNDEAKKPASQRPTASAAEVENGLRMINRLFDRLETCLGHPQRLERRRQLKQLESDLAAEAGKKVEPPLSRLFKMTTPEGKDLVPKTFTQEVAFIRELIPGGAHMLEAIEARDQCRQRVTTLAYLLVAINAESGKYPDKLDAKELGLPPEALLDPSNGQPIQYRVRGGKRLLVCGGDDGVVKADSVWSEERRIMEDKSGDYVDDVAILLP